MIEGLPVDRGPIGPEWTTLNALAGDRFDLAEAYFAASAAAYPGLDRRGQAAFLIGGLSYYLAATLAAFALDQLPLPNVHVGNFALRTDGSATELRYRLAANTIATDRPVGDMIERAMAPLVARIAAETRLAPAAQWRLIADGIAGGFLLVGEARGDTELGVEAAMAIVRDPRFAFFNGHTGFHRIGERVFLKRGGCCRYYTADGEGYCATCILRPPDEQVAELQRLYC